MKQNWKILLLFFALATTASVFAQDATTQGKEFWLSFLGNGFKNNTTDGPAYLKTQVLISSLYNCSGEISNPNTGWSEHFTVEADSVVIIDIPQEVAYMECDEHSTPLNKSLHIVTDQPVSVYCANAARFSFDASFVLPTPALADDYIVQTYDQSTENDNYHTSAFLIIAIEEGETVVDITPAVKTLDGRPANEEYSITLSQGQVYQVRSHNTFSFFGNTSRDLSGSRVKSRDCKKIALFNGNNLTKVASDGYDSDCIFEQAMPLQSWGKQFVVTASLGRERKDYVKITSASNNNVITINGQNYTTLEAYESISLKMQETSYFIEASSRCAVYLYNHSRDGGPNNPSGSGAPSMVWIAPIEQRINGLAFNTFNDLEPNHVSVDRHYVNIIVKSTEAANVNLDGNLIPEDQFTEVTGNNDYKFYRQEISHGAHHLSCEGGFNAHVYGFGHATGYAYMVGSKAADLSTVITVDDLTVSPGDTINNCNMADLAFNALVSYDNYELLWDLGDGSSSTQASLSHTYDQDGLYQVTLTILSHGSSPCQDTTSNTTSFYIKAIKTTDQEYNESICFTGPENYTEHGFNLHYDHAATYHDEYTIPDPNGCNTTVSLTLEVLPMAENEPEEENNQCDFFEWHGNTYTASGTYSDTIVDSTGCYSVHHLKLKLSYSPNPTDIYPIDTTNHAPHWVVTATEFQINSYGYHLWDLNDNWQWDTVAWSFENDDIDWLIEPIGNPAKQCKVYVLSQVEDTVWLQAKVSNGCNPEGVTRRFWLLSSFYGAEEHYSQLQIDIAPNPNNGVMDIIAGPIYEPLEAKVYDMAGLMIDHFIIPSGEQIHYPYHINHRKNGIYCITFNYEEKTITKKIVISK